MNDIDKLTGIFNRKKLLLHLEQCIETAHLNHSNLILLCVNIDNMKRFNGHNGHLAGDELLKRFSANISLMLGEHQSLFRYGGDSFAIVSLNENLKEISQLAQKISTFASTLLFPKQPENCGNKNCMGPVKISVSIGISELEGKMTTDSLLESADKKMYEAKLARKMDEGN